MPGRPNLAKRPQLTLAQLSAYDDVLTDALVDHAYYWTTIPKNRPSYHASRGIREEEITKIVQDELIVNGDLQSAERKLLATDGIRKFCSSLKTDREREDFKQHLRRYIPIYLPDCPFEVSSTNRYTIVSHEACITARRYIKKGETIRYLSGVQVTITPEEEQEISARKKDFSIIVSARSKCTSLFMGPARFANHDCGANGKLMITGGSNAGIAVVATANIDVGEEITVTYGENYFGEDNCECLCQTCEDNLVNGWAPEDGEVVVKKSIEEAQFLGYSLRRRRRGENSREESRTPSDTPDIRPRVSKGKWAKLGQHGQELLSASSPVSSSPGAGVKRPLSSLATPPITPAKKIKNLTGGVTPVPLDLDAECRSSSDGSCPSETFSNSESGDAALTDVTTPEKESPDPVIHSPKPTPIRRPIQVLKQEHSEEEASEALANAKPFTWAEGIPSSGLAGVATRNCTVSMTGALSTDMVRTTASISISALCNTPKSATPSSLTVEHNEAKGAISEGVLESHETPVVDATPLEAASKDVLQETSQSSSPEVSTTSSNEEVESEEAPKKRNYQRRVYKQATPPPPSRRRVPGDYTLTPLLLAEPEAAWIHCTVCSTAFVQQNAYYTRSACPRCERHSKLYGYQWPKTEKAGKSDKEERVLDHRTVHRFLDADDEAKARNRKRPAFSVARQDSVASQESGATPSARGLGRGWRGRLKKPLEIKAEVVEEQELAIEESFGTGLRRSARTRRLSSRLTGLD